MATADYLVCDHINRDGLDNRPGNLRNHSKAENSFNQDSHRGSVSRYKEVYWKKDRGKWTASIQFKKKQGHLGYFESEREAAKAYDQASRKYHGKFGLANFPTG